MQDGTISKGVRIGVTTGTFIFGAFIGLLYGQTSQAEGSQRLQLEFLRFPLFGISVSAPNSTVVSIVLIVGLAVVLGLVFAAITLLLIRLMSRGQN